MEREESRSGFLGQPYIQKQSHQPQTHACGLLAAAHLVNELVVLVAGGEHGSISFRDASDVMRTLRSPSSGCLIHEIIKRERCRKCACTLRRILVVAGKYVLNRMLKTIPVFYGEWTRYQRAGDQDNLLHYATSPASPSTSPDRFPCQARSPTDHQPSPAAPASS